MRKVNGVSVEIRVGFLGVSMNEGWGVHSMAADLVDGKPELDVDYLVGVFKEALSDALDEFEIVNALATGEIESQEKI